MCTLNLGFLQLQQRSRYPGLVWRSEWLQQCVLKRNYVQEMVSSDNETMVVVLLLSLLVCWSADAVLTGGRVELVCGKLQQQKMLLLIITLAPFELQLTSI